MPSNSRMADDAKLRCSLNERLKQMSFLCDLAELLNCSKVAGDELWQAIVDRIIPAFRFPEITCARLLLFDQDYRTNNFVDSPWQQHSNVVVNGVIAGKMTVGRLDSPAAANGEPFLSDECGLIDRCSRQIGQAIERRQLQATLADRENLLNSIMASLPEIICTIDGQGTIRYLNHSTPGNAVDAALGRPVTDFVSAESRQIANDAVRQVLATGETLATEVEGVDPKGITAWYELHLAPLRQKEKDDHVLLIAKDITERVQVETALRASEEKYRLLSEELDRRVQTRTAELQAQRDFARQVMDALGEGLAITDSQGKIEYVNPFLANLVGMTSSAIIGRCWEAFTPPEDVPFLREMFHIRRRDQSFHYEARLRAASGEDVSVLISTTPKWRDGDATGRISLFTDLTQVKDIEDDLRRSRNELRVTNAALEKALHMKDEFLASMSHELRTPLTAILGLSEVLQLQQSGSLTDSQLHAVQGIYESGEHLLGLINDILDVAKLEAAQFELIRENCDVSELCTASLRLINGMAQKKKQYIDYEIEPLSIQLYADPRRLKQMLVNLLSNAVKFTPPSGRLGLRVKGDHAARAVRFVVWDEGIGIADEHLGRLFQPFTQIDSSLSRLYSGTGLGLTLVKRMAELHRGTIEVESTPGLGSTFTLTLPWRQAPSANESTSTTLLPSVVETPQQGSAARILLAEDDESGADMLAGFLTVQGYAVDIAHDGIEAVSLANELLPDLILMDVRMPLQDGLQAIEQLRASDRPTLAKVPIIAVTAQAMHGDDERCIAAGADAYMSKPYKLASLLEVIQEQLHQRTR